MGVDGALGVPADRPDEALVAPADGVAHSDGDRLLAGYRAARAQEPLFPPRGQQAHTGHDEFIDAAGRVRPPWQDFVGFVDDRGGDGLQRLRAVVAALVDNDGITYTDTAGAAVPEPWRLDGLPLLLSAADWETLEAGLLQRSRILDAVLGDLYGPRRALTSGVLPPELLFGHPGYLPAARGIAVPGRHQLLLHGCDVSRAADGQFLANADWTQAPSGAGYALAGRRVVAHAGPDLYEEVAPRPVSPFAAALRLALVDAAPETAEDPLVVVLSPGTHSETAFDQAYLASQLGFPLVESADLVVRDGALFMRSLGGVTRVDVVLRRVDAAYCDPLDLRPDSRLGVAGLVEAARRGAVTVVNTLGAGILESPGLRRFLPELARLLLDEEPELAQPPAYWAGAATERRQLLSRLDSLIVRSTVGGPTFVGPALTAAQRATLRARIESTPGQWVGQELPRFSTAPTDQRGGTLTSAPVGMRLFTVAQRSGYTAMAGGLGYVLAPGAAAFAMETVAAKDVWIRPSARGSAEPAVIGASGRPRGVARPAVVVSSPRVLADLYWIGRYAERAESVARALIVTRERRHEYRHRMSLPGSACVPVMVAALRDLTGGGPGTDEDAAHTVWSLTVDGRRDGSLAHSVARLCASTQAVRDQMSNDTWLVLGGVERALAAAVPLRTGDDTALAAAQTATLAGMLSLAGLAGESMVHDTGWAVMDAGKRIERGLAVTALLRRTLTDVRDPDAERTITESVLVACESSVMYRRRTLGAVSVAAVGDLLLFDAGNPRSLAFQLDRLRDDLRAVPGPTGSSRPLRLVDEIGARLRRSDPAELEEVRDGRRVELADLLDGMHAALRGLSDVVTAAHLSLPGQSWPLWGATPGRTAS
ncbi:circularly permuted type 2 ATP-grasp protein [Mycobacterium sp. MYCO198283]|uniref:circularly permuted type 2 ATP-grasp protein n=1 Tax=Mycobacterium sp. MYCO198283 TaxID=2883505 RepID=UPI001E415B03|nr:circularly permuted type 2 ATP-grasp protein [Mycobacterium sp. MYCO198283]MCG5433647.1 circularly permuted type 2 ATP-grasp protein [Mycobacterium sp. MYCO198283]